MTDIPITEAPPPLVTWTPPHWSQRPVLASECDELVRIPHAPTPFRMMGVIRGGRDE